MATFVDTNVLAYAHDTSDVRRQSIAAQLLDGLWRTRDGVLSTQVLTEFYAVVTRKFDPPMPRRKARALVDAFAAWPVVQVDPSLIVAASALEEHHTLSFWVALIVEAARREGASRLVSEDLQHGHRMAGLVIANPLSSPRLVVGRYRAAAPSRRAFAHPRRSRLGRGVRPLRRACAP